MFGYVRPLRGELKCKDFDLYRASYCGLCAEMRRRHGLIAPMFLNYDFAFLALLLEEPGAPFQPCRGRCMANPLVKKAMCPSSPALSAAADESVILTWWQLRDRARDDGLIRGLPARALALFLRRAYRRAAAQRPEFDRAVGEGIAALEALEREGCPSMDRAADAFAQLLGRAAPRRGEAARDRALEQLLYHLGRWIYLVDAQDDLEEDRAAGRYNAVAARFGPEGDREALARTLDHSRNLMYSAAQLADFGRRWPVIENILYLGLPVIQGAVLDGSWKQRKKQTIWRGST